MSTTIKTLSPAQKQRRETVLARLTIQLQKGVKPCKDTGKNIPLADRDIKRITREIETLTTKLKN